MNNTTSDTITGWRARIYNRLMDFLGVGRVYRAVLQRLPVKADDCVLDIGCGTGILLALLKKRVRLPLTLIGIDASEDMLVEACIHSTGLNIQYQLADAANLPFPGDSFEHIVSVLAFHHMPSSVKTPAIQEISRVLMEGGRLVIADVARPSKRWWGRVLCFFTIFHSYTKGNWATLRCELPRWGLQIVEETSIQGAVGVLVAMKRKK